MLKKLLQIMLLTTTLFSYEIVIDKTSKAPKLEKKSTLTRDDSKEVVSDSATGLMFQGDSRAKSVQKDWSDSKSYCKNLTHAGFSDWRLPSISELESIVDTKKYNPAIKKGFKNVASNYDWSSSPNVTDSEFAWHVNFKYGNSFNGNKTDKYYVRCARAGQ